MLFRFFYDCALFFLGLCCLPKLVWQWGKYGQHFKERLGLRFPDTPSKGPLIWIHAVSLGETRAVVPLYKQLRKTHPTCAVVISSTTETAYKEAKRSMADADAHFFLPLDFSWIMRRLCIRLKPRLLILMESDFWYQLLKAVKDQGGRTALVNGKVSETSARRFRWFRFFSKRLFACIDCFCVQNNRYAELFKQIGADPAKIAVTGNLKLDAVFPQLSPSEKAEWRRDLGIASTDRVVVIGSTHDPEEEQLLKALAPVWQQIPDLKILLVPRHSERFAPVAQHLRQHGYPYIAYSQRAQKTDRERIILIDAIGILNTCYQLAEVAIVAGSFTDRVGGHNIFEPVAIGVPVLFGPHMQTQLDFVHLILTAEAGKQVTLDALPQALLDLLTHPEKRLKMGERGLQLSAQAKGATLRTWEKIHVLICE